MVLWGLLLGLSLLVLLFLLSLLVHNLGTSQEGEVNEET